LAAKGAPLRLSCPALRTRGVVASTGGETGLFPNVRRMRSVTPSCEDARHP
jgi:hypothetical protein